MKKHSKIIFYLVLCAIQTIFAQQLKLTLLSENDNILKAYYSGCASGAENPAPVNGSFEDQLFSLVNAERSQRGVPPYTRLDKLDRAARYHCEDMAVDDYFDHDTYDRVNGQLVKQCSWDVRVKNFYVGTWYGAAENIAAGASTPEQAMNLWMNSPSHRDKILSTVYNEIGVGYYYHVSSTYKHYWTLDFARGTPLPVELSAFDVSLEGKDICVSWITETESNNLGFELQYKKNFEYVPLKFIEGHGTTFVPHHYEYRIKNFPPGYHTFRLKQIDYDGSFTLSAEKTVYIPFSELCYVSEVYPNPFNVTAKFQLVTQESLPLKIELHDLTGRLIKTIFSGTSSANNVLHFEIDTKDLGSGIYLLCVTAGQFKITRRLVYIK